MVEWNGGMEWWNGMVEWNGGMEWLNGMVEWTGIVEWKGGGCLLSSHGPLEAAPLRIPLHLLLLHHCCTTQRHPIMSEIGIRCWC